MLKQIGDPFCVADIRLASRNGLDVLRIHHQEHKNVREQVIDRFPIHSGRFHGHMRASGRPQPITKGEQVRGDGAKSADLLGRAACGVRRNETRHN
jgi:hypothetical protein